MRFLVRIIFFTLLWLGGYMNSLEASGPAEEPNALQRRIEKMNLAELKKAKQIVKNIKSVATVLENLTGGNILKCPGILKIEGLEIGIGNVFAKSNHVLVENLFVGVHISESIGTVYLMATDVKMSYEGKVLDELELSLLGEVPMYFDESKTSAIIFEQLGCTLKCDGSISTGNVKGTFVFDNSVIAKAEDTTQLVVANFKGTIDRDMGMLAELNFPESFVFPNYSDVVYTVKDAVLDMSEITKSDLTPDAVVIGDYRENLSDATWQGIYIGKIAVNLPKKLADEKKTYEIGGQHIIYSNNGFSGLVYYETPKGDKDFTLAGWGTSVDKIELSFAKNEMNRVFFSGQITPPPFKSEDEEGKTPAPKYAMGYKLAIGSGNHYAFGIEVEEGDLDINCWYAQVKLKTGSSLDVALNGTERLVAAKLNGDLSFFKSGKSGDKLEAGKSHFNFESFVVASKLEKTQLGKWTPGNGMLQYLGSNVGLSKGINLVKQKRESHEIIGLAIPLKVNLDKGIDFHADGEFQVLAKVEQEASNRQSWKYDRFKIGYLCASTTTKVFAANGCIYNYEDHAEWGDGYRGELSVQFESFIDGVQAVGQFGKKGDQSYFMVDALFQASNSLVKFGPFNLTGLGGGMYKNMTVEGSAFDIVEQLSKAKSKIQIDTEPEVDKVVPLDALGTSLSGVDYTLSSNNIGFRALVELTTADGSMSMLNSLSMQFSSTASIQNIIYTGMVEGAGKYQVVEKSKLDAGIKNVLMKQEKLGFNLDTTMHLAPFTGKLEGIIAIKLDFDASIYSGSAKVNVQAGSSVKGTAFAGFYVDANEDVKWYFKSDGHLSVGFGKISLGQAEAYIAFGNHEIPEIPEYKFAGSGKVLVDQQQPIPNRKVSGIVFGANASIGSQQDKEWGMLIYSFKGGLGFDMSLLKSTCSNIDQVGINGWYAQAQIYAFLYGKLGVLFKKKSYNFAEALIATNLRGGGPNPFYGEAGFRMKLTFFGFIKVNIDETIDVGNKPEPCALVSEKLSYAEGGDYDSDTGIFITDSYEGILEGGNFFYEIETKLPINIYMDEQGNEYSGCDGIENVVLTRIEIDEQNIIVTPSSIKPLLRKDFTSITVNGSASQNCEITIPVIQKTGKLCIDSTRTPIDKKRYEHKASFNDSAIQ